MWMAEASKDPRAEKVAPEALQEQGRVRTGLEALVCVAQGYGNVIMATPVIRALYEAGYDIDVLCESYWSDASDLLRGHRFVRAVLKRVPDVALYDLVVRTRWHNSGELHCGPELRTPALLPWEEPCIHESRLNLMALAGAGIPAGVPKPFCVSGHEPKEQLKGRVVVAASTPPSPRMEKKRPSWMWFNDVYSALHAKGLRPLFMGSTEDHERVARGLGMTSVAGLWGDRIGEKLGVLSAARAVVGGDCGLLHVAAALHVPVVALFGPTNDQQSRPIGEHVRVLRNEEPRCPYGPCRGTKHWNECTHWTCMEQSATVTVEALADLGVGRC